MSVLASPDTSDEDEDISPSRSKVVFFGTKQEGRASMASPDERNDVKEVIEGSMQSFFQEGLEQLLTPIVTRLEAVELSAVEADGRMCSLENEDGKTRELIFGETSKITALQEGAILTEQKLESLLQGITHNSAKIDDLREEIEALSSDHETLEHLTKGSLQKIADTDGYIVAVESKLSEAFEASKQKVEAMQESQKKLIRSSIDGVETLRGLQRKSSADLDVLRKDVDEHFKQFVAAREAGDRNEACAKTLRRDLQDVLDREQQVCQQVNGCKDQWSKLQSLFQVLQVEMSHVKQHIANREGDLYGYQAGISANAEGIKTLHTYCERLACDVQKLHNEVVGTDSRIVKVQEETFQVTKFANRLHDSIDEARSNLSRCQDKFTGVEKKYDSMQDSLQDMTTRQSELRYQQEQLFSFWKPLVNDLDSVKIDVKRIDSDVQSAANKHSLLSASVDQHETKLVRLENSVQFASAGFTGLQKGITASGANMQARLSVYQSSPAAFSKSALGRANYCTSARHGDSSSSSEQS